ncbi:MAG TPA: universal stress protein, partial [Candidatus Xenobia bacterium]
MGENRPNPEELLRRVQEQERKARSGRLKVFLGYVSSVGKSWRMLDEGRRRRMRGQDVVVGWVQGKKDPHLEEVLAQLEVIPEKEGEMDLDAILKRHPQVVVVDELAHENPAGSKHLHRWEDVQDLLDAGITVITAINVQYLAGLKDSVERLLGVRKPESVPDKFVLTADEVVLVDASPEAIRQRMEGTMPTANVHVFVSNKLQQLREMALLYTADAIEHHVEDYRQTHHIDAHWTTQERILVCVTSHHRGPDLVEKGHRLAQRLHGDLFVVYVTPNPEWSNLTPEQRQKVEQCLALARSYKAKVTVLTDTAPADAISQFAQEHRITQIFIGHTLKQRSFPKLMSQSTVGRIIRQAEGIDVHVVADSVPKAAVPAPPRQPEPQAVRDADKPRGWLKIFMGYAAGVGKTYQMLQDGREYMHHGHDVVVGYFEPHKRPDTIAQLGDLEAVARRKVQYRACDFEEMDTDAIIKRSPEICLVD